MSICCRFHRILGQLRHLRDVHKRPKGPSFPDRKHKCHCTRGRESWASMFYTTSGNKEGLLVFCSCLVYILLHTEFLFRISHRFDCFQSVIYVWRLFTVSTICMTVVSTLCYMHEEIYIVSSIVSHTYIYIYKISLSLSPYFPFYKCYFNFHFLPWFKSAALIVQQPW